ARTGPSRSHGRRAQRGPRKGLGPAQPAVLRRLVGDLEEVREGQGGQRGGDDAGGAGREQQPDVECAGAPEPEAVGADKELADGPSHLALAGALLDLGRSTAALVLGERG